MKKIVKGGLISEVIFTMVPSSKTCAKSLSSTFQPKRGKVEKVIWHHFFLRMEPKWKKYLLRLSHLLKHVKTNGREWLSKIGIQISIAAEWLFFMKMDLDYVWIQQSFHTLSWSGITVGLWFHGISEKVLQTFENVFIQLWCKNCKNTYAINWNTSKIGQTANPAHLATHFCLVLVCPYKDIKGFQSLANF